MTGSSADFESARRIGDDDGSRPLWTWPVLLRDRADYYDDWADDLQRELNRIWASASASMDRDAFENTETARQLWGRGPLWWGVNDAVGHIEVRLHRREREIRITLYTTTARASRKLVKKLFAEKGHRTVSFGGAPDNAALRAALTDALDSLAAEGVVRKRHLALAEWRAVIRHTDLVGLAGELA